MRTACLLTLLLAGFSAFAQEPRPLVIADGVALPLSGVQVFREALKSWPFSFGQEPGAHIVLVDTAGGNIKGVARFNFRSSTLGSREESMGVVHYEVSIQAENGQCRVQVGHIWHTGNHNAPGGGVDIGMIYASQRPQNSIPGVSMGTANRLHDDIRGQVQARVAAVMKNFFSAMRRNAGQGQ